MAHEIYTGKDVRPTFGTMTKKWMSIQIEETSEKAPAKAADEKFMKRVTKHSDAKITIKGLDSDNAAGYSFADVHALKGTSPSALTFTDDAVTPVSKLRSGFFTDYPLSQWCVDDVTGEWTDDPSQWTIVMTPGNLDM